MKFQNKYTWIHFYNKQSKLGQQINVENYQANKNNNIISVCITTLLIIINPHSYNYVHI